MRELNVELGDRAYPIHIGSGLIDSDLLATVIRGRQVLVVTNESIAPLYLDRVVSALTDFDLATVILPDGESHKHIETLDIIFSEALTRRFSRNATMIALGGGVVGDMVGFAAATYQRGIDFIQIPTTLLSQVDSSVGGKTGVNHRLGKNMIGAFHQPVAVFIDTDVLTTLPDKEMSAGMAEVIKYGLLGDHEFLAWIESNVDSLLAKDSEVISTAIERSCQMKADIVARDEREGGVRALLNLGHTFGHAIEARLSQAMGMLSDADLARVIAVCERVVLPVEPPIGMTPDDFMKHMAVDKKNIDGRLRLVLMRSLGDAYVEDQAPSELLLDVLSACCR
ncbi:MAG: 3-dehydroquinate synthase [Gammaproteobacteria bacterium]|nr:3-dehydroquinate synthase [Gammaproteobacteria bacterium]